MPGYDYKNEAHEAAHVLSQLTTTLLGAREFKYDQAEFTLVQDFLEPDLISFVRRYYELVVAKTKVTVGDSTYEWGKSLANDPTKRMPDYIVQWVANEVAALLRGVDELDNKPLAVQQANYQASTVTPKVVQGNVTIGGQPLPGVAAITWTHQPQQAGSMQQVIPAPEPTSDGSNICYTCKQKFDYYDEVMVHKYLNHGYWDGSRYVTRYLERIGKPGAVLPPPQAAATGTTTPQVPVLEYQSKYNLDFTDLPDGRFALSEGGDVVRFFTAFRTKRHSTLKGKYVWTKFRYAYERLPIGTIVFREERSDTKRFMGRQLPGETVKSEEADEELLRRILMDPDEARLLYAKHKSRCSYCGKKLTDHISRQRGIGPDCWDNKHVPWMAKGWKAVRT